MRPLARLALAAAASFCLTGTPAQAQGTGASATASITGTVAHRQRLALPPGASLQVSLEDVTRQDAPARVVSEMKFPISGQQVPLPFQLPCSQADIDPARRYSMRAAILVGDKVKFRLDRRRSGDHRRRADRYRHHGRGGRPGAPRQDLRHLPARHLQRRPALRRLRRPAAAGALHGADAAVGAEAERGRLPGSRGTKHGVGPNRAFGPTAERKVRPRPDRSWHPPPCGSRRCWRRAPDCRARRIPWRSRWRCGRCSP